MRDVDGRVRLTGLLLGDVIREQVLGRWVLALFGAPLDAGNAAQRAVGAARKMLAAMERINEAPTGRFASALGFISAKWSPAISARRGERNIP